jgi:hypothetical protein
MKPATYESTFALACGHVPNAEYREFRAYTKTALADAVCALHRSNQQSRSKSGSTRLRVACLPDLQGHARPFSLFTPQASTIQADTSRSW